MDIKIHELAAQTGLTAHAIRFYEREGLLDSRHVQREDNNYRQYSDAAIERVSLIKKFQGVGCSLAELKRILQDQDANRLTHEEIIEWIRDKIRAIERQKDDLDQMLGTLGRMLEYRMALTNPPEKAQPLGNPPRSE
jgi:DNA-binding transcriptional MerR regulator